MEQRTAEERKKHGRRVPLEIREKMIMCRQRGMSTRRIAARYGYTSPTVCRVWRTYLETGRKTPHLYTRRGKLSAAQIAEIRAMTEENPAVTPREIKRKLSLDVAERTVYRAMLKTLHPDTLRRRNTRISEQTRKLMIYDAKRGLSKKSIAEFYGFNIQTIWRLFRQLEREKKQEAPRK